MNIVIDARTMGSRPSGIGIYLFNFLKEMIKNPNYHIILLTDVATSDEIRYMREQGIEIREYGKVVYRSVAVFCYFDFVKRELRKISPDLFWEPNNLIPANLTGYQGKIMVTVHDVFPMTQKEYFSLKYILYFKMMLKKTVRMTDMILYNSVETKNSVNQYFPISKKKKEFVGYIPFEKKKPDDAGQAKVKESKEPFFLYVGNLEARKGVDLIFPAYEKYRRLGGTKRLVLAGKSREKEIDRMMEHALACVDGIEYAGYVTDEKKNELMQQCDCFLFPSRAEGFGMAVLEAMQYHKPIIVSDLPIFGEIVGDCLNYFEMDKTVEQQSDHLAKVMTEYHEKVDGEQYEQVLHRYEPNVLNEKLTRFLDENVQ